MSSSIAGQVFSFAERSHGRAMALLALLALLCFMPGFVGLQPMDRDEPRFAQATKQMLETGDFVDIRFQTEARFKKPVGIYWMQSAAVAAGEALGVPDARRSIWLYRIPSLLGAILTVLLTYVAAAGLTTRRAAFMAGALMAGVILLGVEARLAKTDAVVAATVCLSMAALARAWVRRAEPECRLSWGWTLAFWISIGVGVLVKGPVTPAVPLLASIVLAVSERRAGWLKRLRPLTGFAIVALIAAPWLVAITFKSGGAFFAESVGQDMLAKVGSGQESHFGYPGTYLAVFMGTAWPLSLFVLLALPFAWRFRGDPAVLFCLAWAVPMWIVFELVPTKLPHYVLPLYPALAILVAVAAEKQKLPREGWVPRVVMGLLPGLVLILAVAATAGLVWLDRVVPIAALAVFVAALAVGVLAWRAYFAGAFGTAALRAAAAAALLSWGAFAFAAPLFRSVAISPRLVAATASAGCQPVGYATAGYREPSLVFLTSTDLVMTDGAGAADFVQKGGCRIAFVEKRLEPAFVAAGIGAGVSPKLLSRVEGINLNGGRRLDIGVYLGQ
ncbi:glycosyltransferase family 39 protein [Alsobacter sp. SYSU M60028]|uniref:Glycosyltransferase family 39 protein n=1 Tax=Alsobacter ponti TaxID=2962936 RepID=A0ABT1LEI1_9HYPH|nr:glycosyltransferase family 39 protein [Alsobacter ponti]MCP8939899.1 glycosyltransferase family 39 protein [Alsobacter ponti]